METAPRKGLDLLGATLQLAPLVRLPLTPWHGYSPKEQRLMAAAQGPTSTRTLADSCQAPGSGPGAVWHGAAGGWHRSAATSPPAWHSPSSFYQRWRAAACTPRSRCQPPAFCSMSFGETARPAPAPFILTVGIKIKHTRARAQSATWEKLPQTESDELGC